MKILFLADEECPYLWDYYQPGRLDGYDLIVSCGDLKPSYLSFLVTMSNKPVLYVHGNHDVRYARTPPEGCDSIEDTVFTYKGIRILGLGGSALYSGGPHQYTEKQMAKRIRKLWWKLRRAGGVDIVVTHAPVAGFGDGEDYAHRGFACFQNLIEKYKPKYLVHGHVHMTYGTDIPREQQLGDTKIINAYERYTIEI